MEKVLLEQILKKLSDLDRKIDLFFEIKTLPDFLTIKETATLLRISEKTIQRLIFDQKIKKKQDAPGKKIIIEKNEIMKFLKAS